MPNDRKKRKASVGQPPDAELRTQHIMVRLTPTEYDTLSRAARAEGRPLAVYVRHHAQRVAAAHLLALALTPEGGPAT